MFFTNFRGCLLNVNCSHQRAHAYFNESFNPKRKFIGERCENPARKLFLELLGKRCSNVVDQMGVYTARKVGRFFVKTSHQFPYSLGRWGKMNGIEEHNVIHTATKDPLSQDIVFSHWNSAWYEWIKDKNIRHCDNENHFFWILL